MPFPSSSRKPSPSLSIDSSLEPSGSESVFVDVRALTDHIFKAPPFADEPAKVQGMIVPMPINSRNEIS